MLNRQIRFARSAPKRCICGGHYGKLQTKVNIFFLRALSDVKAHNRCRLRNFEHLKPSFRTSDHTDAKSWISNACLCARSSKSSAYEHQPVSLDDIRLRSPMECVWLGRVSRFCVL